MAPCEAHHLHCMWTCFWPTSWYVYVITVQGMLIFVCTALPSTHAAVAYTTSPLLLYSMCTLACQPTFKSMRWQVAESTDVTQPDYLWVREPVVFAGLYKHDSTCTRPSNQTYLFLFPVEQPNVFCDRKQYCFTCSPPAGPSTLCLMSSVWKRR